VRILTAVFPEITSIPCKICSPFRADNNPSFSIYLDNDKHIRFKDFGESETKGSLLDLLCKKWNCTFNQVFDKILEVMQKQEGSDVEFKMKQTKTLTRKESSELTKIQVKVRPWRDYDLEYWGSNGITLDWLKWADVYPISHKIITKLDKQYVFPADKYSYVYVEHKDAKVQLKIYSPYNKNGFKWCTSTDRSVWSLWDKIPQFGDNLIITSSLKDCLNIMANLYIPAICLQGEGYNPKPHVVQQLINRYKNIVLFYDNDYNSLTNSGRKDALALHKQYGFPMVEIPAYFEAKDPSDLYKKYGKESYLNIMKFILKKKLWKKNGKI
jgi:hypothetical protein